MRKVLLKRLTLCNFKGEKSRTTMFGERETTIAGGNGLGKSRHFDAFLWLLFGKDRLDRKDYEVKTRVNGEELHRCECSVEGVINVDGEDLTLKRAFMEEWVKPRGQAQEVFKGNRTECWWNEAPVNVGEYDKRVAAIIEQSVFKMLTNPRHFAGMNWKLQREQLLMLAGTVSDLDIAETNPDFMALMERLNGKSFADFRAEMGAKKKRLKIDLAQIQPRIDQTEKLKPEKEDFDEIEKRLASVEAHIAEMDAIIGDATEAQRKQNQQEEAKRSRIHVMESEAQELVFRARQSAKEQAFERDAGRREIEGGIRVVSREQDAKQAEITSLKRSLSSLQGALQLLERDRQTLREQWQAENAKEYNGESVCPHCGQYLPDEMIEKARDIFMGAKNERLAELNRRGKKLNEEIEEKQRAITLNEESTAQAEAQLKEIAERKQNLTDTLADFTPTPPQEVIPEDIPQWVELQEKIRELKDNLVTPPSTPISDEAKEKRKALSIERTELIRRLAKRDQIAGCDKEIASLNEKGRELAQQIADLERQEYIASQFTKKKIDECERRINNMFTCVTFRLFDYTQEGNEIETCIPLIDGVPYGSANTAAQLNAGLDIINTLCLYYGITAPIFIDQAEAVNRYLPTDSQMVYLRVTDDTQLTITTNN